MAPKTEDPRITALRAYKAEQWGLRELRQHGAHAVGVGFKVVDGRVTDIPALRVYVEKKVSRPGRRVVPLGVRVPVPGQGSRELPTDVIECPPTRHHAIDPTSQVRPAPGGVSCGIKVVPGREGATGTLGGWVWDRKHKDVVMLSNAHVLGHRPGTRITQPGDADSIGSVPRRIGTVRRGVDRNGKHPVTVDCAVGVVERPDLADFSVAEVGSAVMAIDEAELSLQVEKYGRSTRLTSGTVDDIDWSGVVQSESTGQAEHLYEDCIRIIHRRPSKTWSAAGDSGSIVFASHPIGDGSGIKAAIALHFGGTTEFGTACRLSNVFAKLDLTTLTDGLLLLLLGVEGHTPNAGDREVGRQVSVEPGTHHRHVRAPHGSHRPRTELAAHLSAQMTAASGRAATLIARHRAELTNLLLHRKPLLDLASQALRPIARGADSMDELFAYELSERSIAACDRFLREVIQSGSPQLRKSMASLRTLIGRSSGASVASLLGVSSDARG